MLIQQTASRVIRPTTISSARMPGPRWRAQSERSGAHTFLVSYFTRVRLLNPQFLHTTASGGSSSLAQCGHRGASDSSTTSIFRPSSSSSSNRPFGLVVVGAAGAGLAAAGLSPPFGALTANASLQCLHLTRLPSYSAGTFKLLPQLGQEMSSVAGMSVPRGRNPRATAA